MRTYTITAEDTYIGQRYQVAAQISDFELDHKVEHPAVILMKMVNDLDKQLNIGIAKAKEPVKLP